MFKFNKGDTVIHITTNKRGFIVARRTSSQSFRKQKIRQYSMHVQAKYLKLNKHIEREWWGGTIIGRIPKYFNSTRMVLFEKRNKMFLNHFAGNEFK